MKTTKPNLKKNVPDRGLAVKILRFRASERLLHWALAVPFLICLASAVVLFVYYNPDPTRPYRTLFGAIHRISGIAFFVLPLLALLVGIKDIKIHFYNIRQGWGWSWDDIKWLVLMGPAAINKKIVLPEQGKFNAGEKLNFMYQMVAYPTFVVTGFYIWEADAAVIPWAIHFGLALLALPLIGGHLFMAMINPESRVGLSGMFSGYVNGHWAKHHYGTWFREHFGRDRKVSPISLVARKPEKRETKVHLQRKFKKSA